MVGVVSVFNIDVVVEYSGSGNGSGSRSFNVVVRFSVISNGEGSFFLFVIGVELILGFGLGFWLVLVLVLGFGLVWILEDVMKELFISVFDVVVLNVVFEFCLCWDILDLKEDFWMFMVDG